MPVRNPGGPTLRILRAPSETASPGVNVRSGVPVFQMRYGLQHLREAQDSWGPDHLPRPQAVGGFSLLTTAMARWAQQSGWLTHLPPFGFEALPEPTHGWNWTLRRPLSLLGDARQHADSPLTWGARAPSQMGREGQRPLCSQAAGRRDAAPTLGRKIVPGRAVGFRVLWPPHPHSQLVHLAPSWMQ